jgi:rubrerythrin
MDETVTVSEIVDFAIKRETTSVRFYTGAAQNEKFRKLQPLLLAVAETESRNLNRLKTLRRRSSLIGKATRVPTAAIRDYLVDVEPTADMDLMQALFFSIMRSETSLKLYTCLAYHADTEDLDTIFESLAQEEAHLKKRLESEYDEYLLQESETEVL